MGCNERRMSSRDLILEFLRLQLYNNTIAITKKPKLAHCNFSHTQL